MEFKFDAEVEVEVRLEFDVEEAGAVPEVGVELEFDAGVEVEDGLELEFEEEEADVGDAGVVGEVVPDAPGLLLASAGPFFCNAGLPAELAELAAVSTMVRMYLPV